MKIATLSLIITLVLAGIHDEFGTMHISGGVESTAQSLVVANKRIVLSKWMTVFRYNFPASTVSISSREHLKVNDLGKLVIAEKPHKGFFVGGPNNGTRLLYYIGIRDFFVCDDNSIETIGSCEGAYRVSIIYDEFLL